MELKKISALSYRLLRRYLSRTKLLSQLSPLFRDEITPQRWVKSGEFKIPQQLFEKILEKFSRAPVNPFDFHVVHGYSGVVTYGIFPDAQFGFILRYEHPTLQGSYPICSIWFDLIPWRRAIFVKQIQGRRGETKTACSALKTIRWEKLLLKLVIEFGRLHEVRTVYVVTAERQDYWNKICPGLSHTFKLRYNVTPRRLGFAPGKKFHSLQLRAT